MSKLKKGGTAPSIDFARYGVDPVLGKKKKKVRDKPRLIHLLNPKNLQTEVSKYGYNFSAKKFYLSILIAIAAAVGVGLLFQLNWYFVLAIFVVCVLCVPSIILTSTRNMYESKRFHDVSNYMEQLLYSFRRKKKILTSLEDALVSFEEDEGTMKQCMEKAIQHILTGRAAEKGDIYREALDIVENEYANNRLRNAHNFLIAVENNGGSVENPVDLLLEDRAMWDERIHAFQKERNAVKRNITISIVFSLALCALILFIMSNDSLEKLELIKHPVVQVSSTLAIIFNSLLYVKIVNKLSQSWLKRENKHSDYQILKDYFYVTTFDKKKEFKTSLIWALALSPIIILGLILSNKVIMVLGAAISVFCLCSYKISYKIAKKNTIKEIEKAFPQWLMELALLLQGNNVQVAVSRTVDTAPVVLRPELEKLVEGFMEDPYSITPYNRFLNQFDLPEIKSAMKMLYSIRTTGTGNIDEQITDLIKKQNILMDKAEKITNEDHLAGFSTLSMAPMLFCILKSLADMTILVFSLFNMIEF